MKNVLVACHDDDVSDARSLAAWLNDEASSLMTLSRQMLSRTGAPVWIANAPKDDPWLARAGGPLGDRPSWDVNKSINMTGAGRAKGRLVIWSPADMGDPPDPIPGVIVAVVLPEAGPDDPPPVQVAIDLLELREFDTQDGG